jgi:Domain of unknown function (DUF4352)
VWTEHRSPAAPEPAPPTPPAEPHASEQPTTVVRTRPAGERVGAHRAPEPDPEPEPTPEPAPPPEPEPGPTAVIDLPASVPSTQATSVIRTTPIIPPPPPPEPSYPEAPIAPPPPGAPPVRDDRRQLIIWFGAACAALLAVLVVVLIYGVFINKPDTTSISGGPSATSRPASPTTSSDGGSEPETASESPTTASGSGPQATDGGLTFAVTGTEIAPTVQYQDAPVERTAQGEFVIVHMTVLNSGDAQGTFLATLQKLKAGGTTYSIDDEATAYLNGTWADLPAAGDTADVAIAFDVPPGTTPESLEVHGDAVSAGVEVPLP